MAFKRFVSLDVAIIGSGTVGSALAQGLAEAGHKVHVGVRDQTCYKGRFSLTGLNGIEITSVEDAAYVSDVIIIATPANAVPEVAYYLGDVKSKIIIDTTFGEITGAVNYESGLEAIERITGCKNVAKCFSTTSYQTLVNPALTESIEMYVAGESKKAKYTAMSLSEDLGFSTTHDLGDKTNITKLEEMATDWIQFSAKPQPISTKGIKVIR